jgi:hypothetical protein
MSKPVTPAAILTSNALRTALAQQALGDHFVTEATRRAIQEFPSQEAAFAMSKLTDEELEAKGWTRQEINVAIHALAPKNSAAFGVHAATERHLNRLRAMESNGGGNAAPAAQGFVLPAPAAPPRGEPRRLTASDEGEE